MAGVGGQYGWQCLFLIEGAPAICLGIAAFLVLPDRPANARLLSASEKDKIARGRHRARERERRFELGS